MNEASTKIKQQIVDKIKSSTNILVTVSRDPSVDELSAALGLTTVLNKLDKHATAIFSGAIPPAITFLEPDKVFENTADSLRDFIIALDKEKADHLRYKVEGDVVKIFITPYRTNISSDDLEFSQGDFNVELVLALGVDSQEHLDSALSAQGQVMGDVTIATFTAGDQTSQLGTLGWHDDTASSLSEMVANLGASLNSEKPLLDKQISTALLTGIVAATDRFGNTHTTPHVMEVAAQLMAAGADQQLIAAKLQESHEITALPGAMTPAIDSTPIPAVEEPEPVSTLPKDSLDISHDTEPAATETQSTIPEPIEPTPIETIAPAASALPEPTVAPMSTLPPSEEQATDIIHDTVSTVPETTVSEPMLGGTLNATSEQAAEDAKHELEDQQNKTLLAHSYLDGSDSAATAPINSSAVQPEETKNVDIFSGNLAPAVSPVADLPLPPPLPDFSTLAPPPITMPSTDMSAFPAMPISEPVISSPIGSLPPASNDPAQFKIPGQ